MQKNYEKQDVLVLHLSQYSDRKQISTIQTWFLPWLLELRWTFYICKISLVRHCLFKVKVELILILKIILSFVFLIANKSHFYKPFPTVARKEVSIFE